MATMLDGDPRVFVVDERSEVVLVVNDRLLKLMCEGPLHMNLADAARYAESHHV